MFKLSFSLCSSYLSYFYFIFCLSQSVVFAKNITDEMELPNNLQSTIDTQTFVSIGETTFSILFWDLYKSQLLTTSGKYPVNIATDKVLFTINYLADISSEDLINRTIDQWDHLGIPAEEYLTYVSELKNMWPDIKEGDSLSLLIHQGRSVFYFNQQYIGVINPSDFGQIFLAIWLSENTSEPNLRRELLGSITHD
ncbi:chalcone isomerase family protein [Colwellia sp. Bg11-28]|uniref:chalcone isomerase family protein n=1 Tax=Colwellia sp. Bg11-28 TaxID=2058305 RepID=UPI001E580C7F|nr:chalcone isomerase family protein [Colwellia sp. Bg11-28]